MNEEHWTDGRQCWCLPAIEGNMVIHYDISPEERLAERHTSAPTASRVKVFRGLVSEVVETLDAGHTAEYVANVKRFLLHVGYHEGARLTARRQFGAGPGRSFFQFEAPLARDAISYCDRRGGMTLLAACTGVEPDDLRAASRAIVGHPWPTSNNTIERLLLSVDLFGIYLARYALLKIPEPIGPTNADHADYWARWWKRVFMADDRADQVAVFTREADEADGL